MENVFDNGGPEWTRLANVICAKLEGFVYPQLLTEIVNADNVARRMWFFGMALYVFDVRVDAVVGSRRMEYFLDHFYEYFVFTVHVWGDVYKNMAVLRERMEEYHGLAGVLGVVDGTDADLGGAVAAGARVDGDEDGIGEDLDWCCPETGDVKEDVEGL